MSFFMVEISTEILKDTEFKTQKSIESGSG